MHILCWLEHLEGRDLLEDLGVAEKIILKWMLEKLGCKLWAGSIWFRIRTSGRVLLTR